MVSKFCFELGKKGILPFWFENEHTYLKRGEDLIKRYEHFDLENAFKKTKSKYKKLLEDESCGPLVEQEKIKIGAESVLATYGYDLSWIKGIYSRHGGFSPGRRLPRVEGWFACDFPRHGNYDGYLLPFISIDAKLDNKMGNKVIIHELIHAARQGICIETTIEKGSVKRMKDKAKKEHILKVKSYEDAFAESIKGLKTPMWRWTEDSLPIYTHKFLIERAKATLKEHLGESAGYVLGRLTYDETKDFAYNKKKLIAFIDGEAKNSLRLQIIKEKLEKGR